MEFTKLTKQNFYLIEQNYLNFPNFWNLNILNEEIKEENSFYYILIINDEVIGFAGFKKIVDTAEIMNIVINNKYRNKKYGTTLFNYLLEQINTMNIKKILLEVSSINKAAIKLYNNCGFKQISIRKNYYNNEYDAIIMEKEIN